MTEELQEFFNKRYKELTGQIIVAEEDFGKYSIAYEHFWGRRAELNFIKSQLEDLLKEVKV